MYIFMYIIIYTHHHLLNLMPLQTCMTFWRTQKKILRITSFGDHSLQLYGQTKTKTLRHFSESSFMLYCIQKSGLECHEGEYIMI